MPMGTIDEAWHRFTCPQCSATETACISDHGSGWHGPSWDDGPSLHKFNVTWSGSRRTEPGVVSAKCVACGADANAEHSYTKFKD